MKQMVCCSAYILVYMFYYFSSCVFCKTVSFSNIRLGGSRLDILLPLCSFRICLVLYYCAFQMVFVAFSLFERFVPPATDPLQHCTCLTVRSFSIKTFNKGNELFSDLKLTSYKVLNYYT